MNQTRLEAVSRASRAEERLQDREALFAAELKALKEQVVIANMAKLQMGRTVHLRGALGKSVEPELLWRPVCRQAV